jgi:putative transcriptional regulator
MNVSRQTVNAIETERYTPSLPLALALARYFELPVEQIFDTASKSDGGRK